jgi:DNA polymerase I-like protein with 3'-5' exonuclease and polymerase domains
LDFETHPIVPGAPRAPEPVGLAARWTNGKTRYLAWGHPCGNNSSFEEARSVLKKAWAQPILFHNAQFDLRVAQDWFGVAFDLKYVHDTKIMAFIHSPNHRTLSLKPLSEEWLKMPPDEQDEMHDWLRANYLPARRTKNPTKYTAFAPGDIAGEYAKGDVTRTYRLYKYLETQLDPLEFDAYRRGVAILYKIIGMEQRGIRIDAERLRKDLKQVERKRVIARDYIQGQLGDINVDSRLQLAEALLAGNLLSHVKRTAKGSVAVSIPALR